MIVSHPLRDQDGESFAIIFDPAPPVAEKQEYEENFSDLVDDAQCIDVNCYG